MAPRTVSVGLMRRIGWLLLVSGFGFVAWVLWQHFRASSPVPVSSPLPSPTLAPASKQTDTDPVAPEVEATPTAKKNASPKKAAKKSATKKSASKKTAASTSITKKSPGKKAGGGVFDSTKSPTT